MKLSAVDAPVGLTTYFYDTLVPKDDPWALVDFRKWLLEKAYADPKIAEELWIMCSRDLLWYISCFVWILEPREKPLWSPARCFGGAKVIPFIPRDYQVDALLDMQSALGVRDMLALKSREMGATWMVLALYEWSWRFHEHQHYGVMSKDEDSADNYDDPDSLLSKIDFIDEHVPIFLKVDRERNRNKHTITNRSNGSTIVGWACTGNVGRSGRKRSVFCDEAHFFPASSDSASLDSLQHTTQSRILISTPNRDRGQAGAFYDAVQNESNMLRFQWHWTIDKTKAGGLYRSDGNQIEYLDPDYIYPQGYKFIRDGKTRSPYYDFECSRAGATPQSIAAELEMDFGGATSRLFDPSVISKALKMAKDPNYFVEVRKSNGEWMPELVKTDTSTPIELWISPESGLSFTQNGVLQVPAGRRYGMGVDIAGGLEGMFSSCSAFAIIDMMTCIQVAEFASPRIIPEDFSIFCAQVGSVFNLALMLIEVTGPGNRFLGPILQFGYRNLWYRPASTDDFRQQITHRVGYDNKDRGAMILGELQDAIRRGKFTPRSKRAIQECERYYFDSNGKLTHPLIGRNKVNAPERSHGDCAIALAGAWYAIHTEDKYEAPVEKQDDAPEGSFAWRRRLRNGDRELPPRYWNPLEAQPV